MQELTPRLIRTDDDRTAALARIALGAVMFPHGAQKLLGWFGGYGFEGTMGYLTGTVGPAAPRPASSTPTPTAA